MALGAAAGADFKSVGGTATVGGCSSVALGGAIGADFKALDGTAAVGGCGSAALGGAAGADAVGGNAAVDGTALGGTSGTSDEARLASKSPPNNPALGSKNAAAPGPPLPLPLGRLAKYLS